MPPKSDLNEITVLTVGERFDLDILDDGMSIILNSGAPMIVFNFSLVPWEIKAFQAGDCSFGLFAEKDLIFFLFKIDGFMDWSDLAFTIHLAGDETIEPSTGYLPFNLVLVESQTKIIKALRLVTVSPAFRNRLVEAITEQAKTPFNTINHYNTIGRIYKKYPSVTDMLNKSLVIEQGGITLPKMH